MAYDEYKDYVAYNRRKEERALRESLEADKRSLTQRIHAENLEYQKDKEWRQSQQRQEDLALKKDELAYQREIQRLEANSRVQVANIESESAYEIAQYRAKMEARLAEIKAKTDLKIAKIQGKTATDVEYIKGGNQNSLAIITSTMANASKTSDVINDMLRGVIEQQRNWSSTVDSMTSQLVSLYATLHTQIRLKSLEYQHTERMASISHINRLEEKLLEQKHAIELLSRNQYGAERMATIGHQHSLQTKALDFSYRVKEKLLDHHLEKETLLLEQLYLIATQLTQKRLGLGNNNEDIQRSINNVKRQIDEALVRWEME